MGTTCILRFICEYYFGACGGTLWGHCMHWGTSGECYEHIKFFNTHGLSNLCIFITYTKRHFRLEKANIFKNFDSTTFEAKMSYYREHDIRMTHSCATCVLIKRENSIWHMHKAQVSMGWSFLIVHGRYPRTRVCFYKVNNGPTYRIISE